MIYKKPVISFFIPVVILAFSSCAPRKDLNGIYVHFKGQQNYYTLTVTQGDDDKQRATLEGVPLDLMKSAQWSLTCEGDVRNDSMKCGSFTIHFDPAGESAEVTYNDGSKQVFISNTKSIEEEITSYEKNDD